MTPLPSVGVPDDVVAPPGLDGLRPVMVIAAFVTALIAIVTDPGPAVENGIAVAAALPLAIWAWRGDRIPLLAVVLVTCALEVMAQRSGGLEALMFLLCLVAMAVGMWERSMLVAGLLAAVSAFTPQLTELLFDDGILTGVWFMGIGLSFLLGRAVHQQMQTAAELVAARQELARQAVLDEKRRIARDVHDLVGHGLAAVMLQVTGARHVLRRDLDAADEALAEAEVVGRRSMQELRRTLSLLRASDDSNGLGPGAAGGDAGGGTEPGSSSSVAPLPGIGDIADAVATSRATGADTAFQADGHLDQVDPIVGLALHRVVEEALANARRHAPDAVTDVHLRVGDDHVSVTVETIGPIPPVDPRDAARPRYGLIGMRERIASVAGDLDAGPTPTGWLVTARAPLAVEATGPRVTPAEPVGTAEPEPPPAAETGHLTDTAEDGDTVEASRVSGTAETSRGDR